MRTLIKLGSLGLFLLFLIPLVNAVTIESGTIVKSEGLNLTFNFTSTRTTDTFIVSNTSIYFDNYNSNEDTEYLFFTYNFTEQNKYYGNAIPISFTSSSPTQKVITSSLTQGINTTVVAQFDTCSADPFTLTSGSTVTDITSGFTCSGGVYTFSQLQINNGANTLETDEASCQLGERIGYPLILIFVSLGILCLCFFLLKGDMDLDNMEFANVNLNTIIIVFFLVILGVGFLVAMADTIATRCTL